LTVLGAVKRRSSTKKLGISFVLSAKNPLEDANVLNYQGEKFMKLEQSWKSYVAGNRHCQKVLRILQRWDEKKTLRVLSKELKLNQGRLRSIAKQYNLAFVHVVRYRNGQSRVAFNTRKIKSLLNLGFTYEEIGRVYNVSRQRIHQVLGKRDILQS